MENGNSVLSPTATAGGSDLTRAFWFCLLPTPSASAFCHRLLPSACAFCPGARRIRPGVAHQNIRTSSTGMAMSRRRQPRNAARLKTRVCRGAPRSGPRRGQINQVSASKVLRHDLLHVLRWPTQRTVFASSATNCPLRLPSDRKSNHRQIQVAHIHRHVRVFHASTTSHLPATVLAHTRACLSRAGTMR